MWPCPCPQEDCTDACAGVVCATAFQHWRWVLRPRLSSVYFPIECLALVLCGLLLSCRHKINSLRRSL